eukprot:GFUD01021988.1.p1 GENE.GFUD01021988.1~~GFUD01021988.1.p1  ORF type:complete len:220 (-),score=67.94 GFUD01021988.1:130-789(-)
MAGIVGGTSVEEEYLWSCTLSGAAKEFSWAPEDPSDAKDDDENDPSVKPGHKLLIKSAILMPSAKADEVTVVQIESEGYNKKKVIVPICAMKGGRDHQRYIDLLVPSPATLKLLQGEGPIHLIGSHCIDFYGYRDVGAGDSEEEDDATDNDAEMEEAEEVKEKGDKQAAKKTPTKEKDEDKADEKKAPAKEDSGSKKRKASAEVPKGEEKKKKESPAKK